MCRKTACCCCSKAAWVGYKPLGRELVEEEDRPASRRARFCRRRDVGGAERGERHISRGPCLRHDFRLLEGAGQCCVPSRWQWRHIGGQHPWHDIAGGDEGGGPWRRMGSHAIDRRHHWPVPHRLTHGRWCRWRTSRNSNPPVGTHHERASHGSKRGHGKGGPDQLARFGGDNRHGGHSSPGKTRRARTNLPSR